MALERINEATEGRAKARLLDCCHCEEWAIRMEKGRPYASLSALQEAGTKLFLELGEKCWLEAFAGHPKIGDVNSLKEKYRSTAETAGGEQKGVSGASEATLRSLMRLNEDYERKFGFIFIVFATGKSADQMLGILESRIGNTREQELRNAAEEQCKITRRRMEKLL